MTGSDGRAQGPATPVGYHDADFISFYDWMWSTNGLGLKLGSMKAVLYARIYGASHHATGAMFETQSSLASSLGFSREKTSKALKELVADGLVAIVGRLGSSPKAPALYVADLNRVAAAVESMRAAAGSEGTAGDSNAYVCDATEPVIDSDVLFSCGFEQSAGHANVENLGPTIARRQEEPASGSPCVTKGHIGVTKGHIEMTNGHIGVTKGHIGSTCGLLKTAPPVPTCGNVNKGPAQRGCINPLIINAASIEGEWEGEGTNKDLKTRRAEPDGMASVSSGTAVGDSAETGGACTLSPDGKSGQSAFWALPEGDREAFGRLLRIGKHVDDAHLADTRLAFAALLSDGWEAKDVVEAYEAYFADFNGPAGENGGRRSERYAMWLVSWLTKASGARKWLARVGAKRHGDRAPMRRKAVTFGRATDGTWFADRGHGDIVPLSAALGHDASEAELMADYQASYPVADVV